MDYISGKAKNFWVGAILLAFLSLVFFGLFSGGMAMDKNHNAIMSPCPYMQGASSLCTMNFFEHIAAWQNALRAIPAKDFVFQLASFLFLALLSIFYPSKKNFSEKQTEARMKHYFWKELSFKPPIFEFLFSQGILNTKAY